MQDGTKWLLSCGNAFIDGMIINDFDDDNEAAEYAANYEATCYRIDPDGSRTVIYTPGGDEWGGRRTETIEQRLQKVRKINRNDAQQLVKHFTETGDAENLKRAQQDLERWKEGTEH